MKNIFVILWIFGATSAMAQTLSLEQALSEARGRNPDLVALKAKAERLSWAKLDAASTYIPHIKAGYEHYFNSHYLREEIAFGGAVMGFPAAYPQDALSLEVEMTLFDGFSGIEKFKGARLSSEAADLDYKRAEFQLDQRVRNAYYQVLAAIKLHEVAAQNVKTLEDHLNRARVTERAGYSTRFDVLRIEATLEEARADLENAEDNVHIARHTLSELLGIEKSDDRTLVGNLPELGAEIVPKDLSVDAEKRDDVQAQFKRDESSKRLASAARGVWFPSVSVFADEQFYKFGDFDPAVQSNSSFQQAWALGLRLRWNLFDGGHSYAQQREMSAAAVEAAAETQKTLVRLPLEIDNWKRKYKHAVSLYKARVRALAQFQESVRLALIGVRAGSRTHTEVLDAELDLFRARGGLVKAQAEAVEALGQLELALGRRLWRE